MRLCVPEENNLLTWDVCPHVQISDVVYTLVQGQCQAQYESLLKKCEAARPSLEASIRTDMDQIISSKEHVTNKIRGLHCSGPTVTF